jgi:heme oxygenase
LIRLQARSQENVETLRQRLRAETAQKHEAVEEAMSRWNLSDRGGYAAFLSVHHAALKSLASQWRFDDRPDFEAMLRRLEADHAALGVPVWEPSPADAPSANGMGIAYVVRGSRLGSRVLRKRVAAHFPATFLGQEPSLTWSGFLDQLDRCSRDTELAGQADVVSGARATFDLFRTIALQRGDARL